MEASGRRGDKSSLGAVTPGRTQARRRRRDRLPPIGPDDTVYVVAGVRPGADISAVVASLRSRLPHLDVFDRNEFSERIRRYWMLETGMGIGFLMTSALAIAAGTVIVSQAIYAATAEHLPEFGTLKAMGMGNTGLGLVVLWQAVLAGLAGGLPGCLLGLLAVRTSQAHGLEATLPPGLIVAAAAVAALTSIARVRRLDAALVFRARCSRMRRSGRRSGAPHVRPGWRPRHARRMTVT